MSVAEQAGRRFDRVVFFIGPSYDDLVPVFVIDGRDFSDTAAASAERMAASAALSKAHIIAEVEKETIEIGSPRLALPSWPQWRDRELPGGQPTSSLPVRPAQILDASLRETVAAAASAGLNLRNELLTIAVAAFPSGCASVSRPSSVRRRGAARVGALGELYGCDMTVSIRQEAEDGRVAIVALSHSLAKAGWQVGVLEQHGSDLVLPAERSGKSITGIYVGRSGAMRLIGRTESFEVVAERTESR